MDVVRLRLQVQRPPTQYGDKAINKFYYKNVIHGIYRLAREEGVLALFNGSMARAIYHVPNVAMSLYIIEFVRPVV